MLVSPRSCRALKEYRVKLGQTVLDNVTSYNYLRVVIYDMLNFNEFLKEICDKINICLYQLIKMRKFITADIASIIYKQVVVPLLDYANFLIDSSPAYFIRRIENLHDKALRVIDCKKHKTDDKRNLEIIYRVDLPK